MMIVVYTLLGILIAYMLITGWCLSTLNKRKSELSERLHLLARLGEDWQNEKAEIEYYRAQSSWALIKFCWKEESREFDIEKMLRSNLLNNKGW